jgi:hypothetical protein
VEAGYEFGVIFWSGGQSEVLRVNKSSFHRRSAALSFAVLDGGSLVYQLGSRNPIRRCAQAFKHLHDCCVVCEVVQPQASMADSVPA